MDHTEDRMHELDDFLRMIMEDSRELELTTHEMLQTVANLIRYKFRRADHLRVLEHLKIMVTSNYPHDEIEKRKKNEEDKCKE